MNHVGNLSGVITLRIYLQNFSAHKRYLKFIQPRVCHCGKRERERKGKQQLTLCCLCVLRLKGKQQLTLCCVCVLRLKGKQQLTLRCVYSSETSKHFLASLLHGGLFQDTCIHMVSLV